MQHVDCPESADSGSLRRRDIVLLGGAFFFAMAALVIAVVPSLPREVPSITLEVSDPVRRLGVVEVGDVIATTFELHNPSSRDAILIDEVRPSCGCTVPTLETREIAAGSSTTMKVFFRVPDEPGTRRKRIGVTYQQVGREELNAIDLTLEATVARPVEVVPDHLVFVRPTDFDEEADLVRSCEVRSRGESARGDDSDSPLRIVEVKTTDDVFRARLLPSEEGWRIEVRCDPDGVALPHRASLLIQTARDGQSPHLLQIPMIVAFPSEGEST